MVPDIISQSGFSFIDAAIIIILVLSIVIGAVRGLFRTLAGLAILILALLGGGIAARLAAPPVAERLYPAWEARLSEEKRQELLEALTDPLSDAAGRLSDLLPEEAAGKLNSLLDSAEAKLGDAAERLEEAQAEAIEALARAALESAVRTVLRVLFSLLLFILLHILAKAVDLMMKLPVLHQFNAMGGALIGVAEGLLLILLFLWLAHIFGLNTANSRIVQLLPFLL